MPRRSKSNKAHSELSPEVMKRVKAEDRKAKREAKKWGYSTEIRRDINYLYFYMGLPIEEAENIVLKDYENGVAELAKWKANGVFPYGDADIGQNGMVEFGSSGLAPMREDNPSVDRLKELGYPRDYVKVGDNTLESIRTPKPNTGLNKKGKKIRPPKDMAEPKMAAVARKTNVTEVKENPTEITGVSDPVALAIATDTEIEEKIRLLINQELDKRFPTLKPALPNLNLPKPKMFRSMNNTAQSSYRFPKKLLSLAKTKLEAETNGTISLTSYLEWCLWLYVGSPRDLLEPEE